jgi:D-aspartate ligase
MANNGPIATRRLTRPVRHSPDSVGAVILGVDPTGPLGLGIVRSLGRHGIPVWVLTGDHSLAAFSRYTHRTLPWPATDETYQIDYLLDLAVQYQLDGWMLFPNGDEIAALMAHHYERLAERYRLTTPPWDVLRWAYDKRLTYRLAAEIGVDYPWTCYPSSCEEIAALDCAFPVILKPAIKKGHNHFTYAKAWRVEDREDLLVRYHQACVLVDPSTIMVQELIPGGGETQFSYVALCEDGYTLAWAVARRTRQYPIDFGRSSTYVETIDQPEVEEPARRLLAAIGYTGLVEIEFKRDLRDGRYKLLDFNARAWTWHMLGGRAGVDFPYLLWRLIQGESVREVCAQPGVRWVRMMTDLLAAGQEIRQGRLSTHAYLRSLLGPLECAIFAADDPLPALLEVPLMAYNIWKRR